MFAFLTSLVILFYLWAKTIWLSLILILIVDSFSLQFLSSTLKKAVSNFFWKSIKITYSILLVLFFAIFIRVFFFEIYLIPSSSMETELSVGDIVIVNKLYYGPLFPNHISDVPYGNIFHKQTNNNFSQDRLKGIGNINRYDIVVFKDKNKESFIKRIIGQPGDTLQIINSIVYINNVPLKEKETYCFNYLIKDANKNKKKTKNYSNKDIVRENNLTRYIDTSFYGGTFPGNFMSDWTLDNYGPIIIPKNGLKIKRSFNEDFYNKMVSEYTEAKSDKYYEFKNNYYFLMGDNRHNSGDSRLFGLIPDYAITGKIIFH